ncbi:Protein BCCIP like protein [Argiope bruennichi]|uniref:Protein BCCIP homolog n=1 Tax=Argiope bruennichi TaxID=94029 RepID=A0A8T0EFA0_ARGBR|nr:Protein BCCIP like protein [Argiope bruennichi]
MVLLKQKSEEEFSSESDSNSEAEEMQTEPIETIQVDFDVKVPEPSDFHGIKNLLHQLFLKAHINTSELTDLLIQQRKITGVIKQAVDDDMEADADDEEDLDVNFGVFSVVNLTEKNNLNSINEIKTYLLSHCKKAASDEDFQTFQRILDDKKKHVGLIISERMVNIPPKIAVPLYSGLSYDMAKAKSKGEAFDFEYFILICKIVVFKEGKPQESVMYANGEEELIAEVATLRFDFSVSAELDSGLAGGWTDESSEGHRKRRVLVFPASQWDTMYNKLAQEVGT